MFRDQQLMLKGFSGGTVRGKVTAFQKQLGTHGRVASRLSPELSACPGCDHASMQAHFQPSLPVAPPRNRAHTLLSKLAISPRDLALGVLGPHLRPT